jgi:hypothetical protein
MFMLALGMEWRPADAAAPQAAVTSLEILPAAGLQAADGVDAADANGWVARIVLPDAGPAAFDPNKIVLTVSDPGYSAPAAAPNAVVVRTIRGGAVLRRQYPNQATALNSGAGGSRTIYFSLEDWIFGGSTIVAALAEPGFYGAAQAGAIAAVVNGSTKSYYKPLASWASLQHERRTGPFAPELVVTHLYGLNGRMAAGVRFRATDEGAGSTGDLDVTAVTLSQEATQGNPFEVFRPTVPLDNLGQGQRCILNARVYPWLGDGSAILDLTVDGVATSGDWSNANPRTPLRFFCDKTGGYGGAVAVVEAGASGGAVQASLAAARATPFPTIEAAYAALPAWNSANKGHNDCGGADIYLRNMTASPASFAPASVDAPAGKTWVNIRQDPANGAAAGVTFAASRYFPPYTRFMVPITQSSGVIDGYGLWAPFALEATTLTISGATAPIHFRQPAMCYRNLTVTGLSNANASFMLAGGNSRQQVAQAVGVVCEDSTVDAHATGMFSLLGCRFKRFRFEDASRATNPLLDSFDGAQFVATSFLNARNASVSSIGDVNPIAAGFHVVNFLVEGTMAAGGGAWRLSGDGAVAPVDNVLVAYATVPGTDANQASVTRVNFGYTDAAGAVGVAKRIAIRFSILYQANIKADTFTANTTISGRTQNWATRYGVRHKGNVRVRSDANNSVASADGNNWTGEHLESGSVINAGAAAVGFADNRSGAGAAGSGSYLLTGASNAAYGRVPEGQAMCAFDLAANARLNTGAGAAGAYERS